MKFALIDDVLSVLTPDTYDRIPSWRVLAARGRVRCPGCGGQLRLMAPIRMEPYFRHDAGSSCPLQGMDEPPAEWVSAEQAGSCASEEQAGTNAGAMAAVRESAAGFSSAAAADRVHAAPAGTAASPPLPQPESAEERRVGSFRLPKNRPIHDQETASTPTAASGRSGYRLKLAPRETIRALARKMTEPLHPKQRLAVETTEGPLLILAGAGSGKTRVMTARTAHLIRDKGVDPRTIMVVTFTTKAAEEIRTRLSRELGSQQARQLVAGTFHSLFYRMLLHHDPERWDQRRLLKQEWEKIRLLRESGVLQELTDVPGEAELEEALALISRWKNEFRLPQEAVAKATAAERLARELYPLYEAAKAKAGRFDFDDMLIGCHQLLTQHETVRRQYQQRIAYVMIDEFQDINRVQYEVVKMLAAPQNNLCAIGDDDQSIYGFRGSDPQFILGFTRDFPGAQVVTLDVNYRSRAGIVSLGASLITNNRDRWQKEFVTCLPDGESHLFYPADEEEQASRIVDEIALALENGAVPDQFAILFRTYESTRPLAERLTEAGIPFSLIREEEPLYRKPAVRWALSYLRLAVRPDDESALREMLPSLYLSADRLNEARSLAILEDTTLVDVLPRLEGLKSFQRKHLEKVAELLGQLPACTPAQALELVYEDLKLREYVRKRMRERNGDESDERGANELRELLVAARRHLTLPEFLRHIDAMLAGERHTPGSRPSPNGGVQLLSIHRAKGLEFDNVFLVDLVEGSLPHEYTLDQLRQGQTATLEEERRLLYVAITRARHRLFIGVPQERFGRRTRPSRFIAEMGRAVSVDEPADGTATPVSFPSFT